MWCFWPLTKVFAYIKHLEWKKPVKRLDSTAGSKGIVKFTEESQEGEALAGSLCEGVLAYRPRINEKGANGDTPLI